MLGLCFSENGRGVRFKLIGIWAGWGVAGGRYSLPALFCILYGLDTVCFGCQDVRWLLFIK